MSLRLPNWFRNFVKVMSPMRVAKKEERASELVGWGHSGARGKESRMFSERQSLFYIGQTSLPHFREDRLVLTQSMCGSLIIYDFGQGF